MYRNLGRRLKIQRLAGETQRQIFWDGDTDLEAECQGYRDLERDSEIQSFGGNL